jgi:elongation factor G
MSACKNIWAHIFSSLRTMTSGRGQFSMLFKNYMSCPNNVAEGVIEKVKADKAAKKK